MSKVKLPPESEVASWLKQLIEEDELLESIQGQDAITTLTDTVIQEHFLPSFGIDHISRRASAEAANLVLSRLSLLDIISINTSISLTSGEVLRPDILCFNPETKTLVVFEIKRAGEPERQTVTELAGYEQELRNMLPFLGSFDVCFVVVASEWSTLLVHAVGSMNAWSGKQCLALKLTNDETGLGLVAHLPEAWHLTGSTNLPAEALPSIDLYLAYKGTDEGFGTEHGDVDRSEEEESTLPPRIVLTAMDVIARAGDRAGSHGFMMLWRDVNGFGRGRWCITLAAIDPYSMHAWCRDHGLPQRESEAATFFHERKGDLLGQTPSTVYDIARAAFPILQEQFAPEFGGDFHWHLKTRQYRHRAVPTRFDFWGSLGQHAREFVSNPSVRNNYMPFVGRNQLDWTDPAVAMTLVTNLSQGNPFPRGVIKCSDAFLAGRVLGDLLGAAFNTEPDKEQAAKFEPLVEWAQLEALRFAIEMKQMYDITDEIMTPMPVLSRHPAKRVEATVELAQWVRADLISSRHPFHRLCFDLGYRHALLFHLLDEQSAGGFDGEVLELAASIRNVVKGLLKLAKSSQGCMFSDPGYLNFISFLNPYLGHALQLNDAEGVSRAIDAIPPSDLVKRFTGCIVRGADSIIPVVLHSVRAPFPTRVDWEWLKSGIRALFESGDLSPAIIFSQDGMVGSGRLGGPFKNLPPISDPDAETYVLDESSGSAMAFKMTWAEVMDFHSTRNQGY